MSVQDSIAGQNLSQNNVLTAQKMLELQGQNARANQSMQTEVRNQDINREKNLMDNLNTQQNLGIQQQNADTTRTDMQNTNDRGNALLGIQQQQANTQQQNVVQEHERGLKELDIKQQGVDVQKGELGLKQAQELIKRQQAAIMSSAFQNNGLQGGMEAAFASGDIKTGLDFAEKLNSINRNMWQNEESAGKIRDDQQKFESRIKGETLAMETARIKGMPAGQNGALTSDQAAAHVALAKQMGYGTGDPQQDQMMNLAATQINNKDKQSMPLDEKVAFYGGTQYGQDLQAAQQAGKPITNININDKADAKAMGEAYGKRLEQADTVAQASRSLADQGMQAYQAFKQSPIKQGASIFTAAGEEGIKLAAALGFADPEAATPGLTIKNLNQQMALKLRMSGGSSPGSSSNYETQGYQAGVPSKDWTEDSAKKFAFQLQQKASRDEEWRPFMETWKDNHKGDERGMIPAWRAYINENPAYDPVNNTMNYDNLNKANDYTKLSPDEASSRAAQSEKIVEQQVQRIQLKQKNIHAPDDVKKQMTPQEAQAFLKSNGINND